MKRGFSTGWGTMGDTYDFKSRNTWQSSNSHREPQGWASAGKQSLRRLSSQPHAQKNSLEALTARFFLPVSLPDSVIIAKRSQCKMHRDQPYRLWDRPFLWGDSSSIYRCLLDHSELGKGSRSSHHKMASPHHSYVSTVTQCTKNIKVLCSTHQAEFQRSGSREEPAGSEGW